MLYLSGYLMIEIAILCTLLNKPVYGRTFNLVQGEGPRSKFSADVPMFEPTDNLDITARGKLCDYLNPNLPGLKTTFVTLHFIYLKQYHQLFTILNPN